MEKIAKFPEMLIISQISKKIARIARIAKLHKIFKFPKNSKSMKIGKKIQIAENFYKIQKIAGIEKNAYNCQIQIQKISLISQNRPN